MKPVALGGILLLAQAGGPAYWPGYDAGAWSRPTVGAAAVAGDELSAWVIERHDPPPVLPPAPWRSRRDAWSGDAWTSVANRNNNPLNVKLGARTQWYVEAGVARPSDIIPRDGGRFLKFDSPEAGFRAAADLLTARLLEDGGLDRALRRWSNNGYGAEIVAGTSFEARRGASGVGRDDLRILLNAMAAAEGYRSAALANEVERALKD